MKHLSVIALAALASCLAADGRSGDPVKEVLVSEQNFSDALLRGDWKMVEQIEAEDLVFTNADGSVTGRSDDVGHLRSGDVKFESIEMSETKVQELGDTAVVTGKLVEKVHYKATDLSGTYRFTDVWAKRNGRWLLVSGHETRVAPLRGSQPSARDRLLGTWRLVSTKTFRSDGSLQPYLEYGANPRGYLMYDNTGHMCAFLANPNHPRWANAEKPTDAEKVRSYDVLFAYCGTYEVLEKEGRVIHRPEMGSLPHFVGTDQARKFQLEEDRLVLSSEETPQNAERRRYQITWQRVSP